MYILQIKIKIVSEQSLQLKQSGGVTAA